MQTHNTHYKPCQRQIWQVISKNIHLLSLLSIPVSHFTILLYYIASRYVTVCRIAYVSQCMINVISIV